MTANKGYVKNVVQLDRIGSPVLGFCHMEHIGINQSSGAGRENSLSFGDIIFNHTGFNVKQLHFLMPVPGYKTSGLLAVKLHIGTDIRKIRHEIRQYLFFASFPEFNTAEIFQHRQSLLFMMLLYHTTE